MHRLVTAALAALVAMLAPLGAGPAPAQSRWVMATAYPDANFHTQTVRAFLADIEAAAPGKLAVQLHTNASLMPLTQIKRGVQTGQVQLGEFLLGAYGNEDPVYEVDFIPFLASNWTEGRALGQAVEPAIRARLERQGLTALYMVPWPSQGLYSRTELRSVEDLRGSRFRAQTPIIARMAELLGATPVLVQAADIPQAFATGIVNAMVTSAQTGVDSAAWDYSKYFYNIGFTLTRNVVVANTRALRSLDAETQGAITAAAERAAARGLEASQASERQMTARLQAQGMQTPVPSESLMSGLRAIGARQEEEWLAKAGPDGRAMLDRYRALLRQ
jgi:TRAP-type C4-dicarboxylate transport system substrate-binding protein